VDPVCLLEKLTFGFLNQVITAEKRISYSGRKNPKENASGSVTVIFEARLFFRFGPKSSRSLLPLSKKLAEYIESRKPNED